MMNPAVHAYYLQSLVDMLESGYVGQYEILGCAAVLGYRGVLEQLECCEGEQPYTSLDNLLLLILAAEGELQ